jgi:SpoIID/LytB domain protein
MNEEIKKLYEQQYSVWELARKNIDSLKKVETRTFVFDGFEINAQFNSARIVSSAAKTDAKSIRERKCFLCAENRPEVQKGIFYDNKFEILVNPFPILPYHFVIARNEHTPQEILPYFSDMLNLAKDLDEFTLLYNGPEAGASAPDHFHFQAVERGHLPVELEYEKLQSKIIFKNETSVCRNIENYLRSCIVIESSDKGSAKNAFERIYKILQQDSNTEPKMNVFCLYKNNTWITFVFPREKHRPTQYYADGDENMMISPGAIDIAGILIMPRKEDFDKLNKEIIEDVFRQVSKDVSEPTVSVGIMSEKEIEFVFNGEYKAPLNPTLRGDFDETSIVSYKNGKICFNGKLYDEITFSPTKENADFELKNVTIGINFHWERKENQRFSGALKFIIENEKITAINILPVEDYIKSVISSEMSASASLELLKAHAVISRSWLLANSKFKIQDLKLKDPNIESSILNFEFIKWYERDAHTNFDVCADDHCQRYQGITRTNTQTAIQAVEETRGEVLMSDGKICDTRFSKSCGGMSEKFENCWADVPHSYLTNVRDVASTPLSYQSVSEVESLTIEENSEKWIRQSPPAFCNTQDKKILAQVLNNYDQETTDFYRWKVVYSQTEISELLKKRSGIDFGEIIDLIPVERGASSRLIKLKIVGTKQTITVGKELEIRKWLSESHLYSSAFVIDKGEEINGIPQSFTLIGAGWGHGVGLCQIGAAVMGEKGYKYNEILAHYYKGSELKKLYF